MAEDCTRSEKELVDGTSDCQSVLDEKIEAPASTMEEVSEEAPASTMEEVSDEAVEEIQEESEDTDDEELDEEALVPHPEEDSKMKKLAIKAGDKAKDVGKNVLAYCKKVVKKTWEYDKKVGRKMLDTLINPASEISNVDKELPVAFTIGAVLVGFIFLTHLIDPMFVGYEWEIGLKAGMALWIAIIPLATILVASMMVYLFSKKGEKRAEFEEVLAAFCLASAPSTIFYMIGYVLSFKWNIAMAICLLFAVISWVLLSTEVASQVLKERNRTYWVMFLITVLTIIIIGVCGMEVAKDVVTGVLDVFNDYVQEVTLESKTILIEMLNDTLLGN